MPPCLPCRLLAFALLIGLLAGCGSKENGTPPPAVETASVQPESWQTEINAIGTLSPNQGIIVKPEIDGRITQVFFRSGDYTQAGAPLVQLNPDTLKAGLEAAKAKATLSAANYRRTLALAKKRVVTQSDLDTAYSTYQADQANVANTQAQLNQTLIRAPFSGRLGLRQVDMGDYVNKGDSIATLNAIDPLRIDFKVPEVYLSQLAIGQTVLVYSSTYPKQVFIGQIYAFDAQIDPNTRSLGVRAILPNKKYQLLPGAFVEVSVQAGTPQKWIAVPETAISSTADGQYVYKIKKNIAIKTKVITGPRKEGKIAIINGLVPGDVIVTIGAFKLHGDGPVMAGK